MSPAGVLYVCVIVGLFPAILSQRKTAMSRHQLELKEHYEHLAKIAEFECDQPQPRLLNMHELLSDFQMRGKAYFPEVTLLHRCDRHVGSCNDATYQCGPTQATPVNMPFKVTFLDDMGGHKKGEWEMEYHSLENHTSCGCLKYDAVPKPPPKTAVHYHYVDPSLMPPKTFLPLDTQSQSAPGNASSYDVPVYQFNTTAPEEPNTDSRPSLYDMTKVAEQEVRPAPVEENEPKDPCLSCTESQGFPGYPGYPSSEPSTANEVRDSSSSPQPPSYVDQDFDAEATTLTLTEIRFGAGDSPRFEALTDTVESPYDSLLKHAST